MILIADGGSTKVDWIALDNASNELFRERTLGLNPAVVLEQELISRIQSSQQLNDVKEQISQIYFYGAGCGTPKPTKILHQVLQSIFTKATIHIAEDMLGAVNASSGKNEAIVCILGTGSNSCYFNGENMKTVAPSLGYSVMDEASGNYFGKLLIRDYYYKKMPTELANKFRESYNLEADFIKRNLYKEPNPNRYLASFAEFMFLYKDHKYIRSLIENGFQEFFDFRVLPFKKPSTTPIYFIGSIAYYFREILEQVAANNGLKVTDVIQRPIDNLIAYHKKYIR